MSLRLEHSSSVQARPLVISVSEGRSAFKLLRDDWNALFRRAGLAHNVFQSHALLSVWARIFVRDEVIVICAREGEQLVGVLPLARRTILGVRRLELMGHPIAQFSDMIVDQGRCDVAQILWQQIGQLGADLLELPRIRADSTLWQFKNGAMVTETMGAPWANLAKRVSGSDPGPAYSSNMRSNLRRRARRLGGRGKVALLSHLTTADCAKFAIEAIEMKKRSLKSLGARRTSVARPEFANFFVEAAADPECGLMVSVVQVADQAAAIDLSFLCKGTVFGHVLALDPAYRKDGAGSLLLHHAFSSAKMAGAGTFDLLSPADDYKMQHADGVTMVESRIYPFTTAGRVYTRAYHRLAVPVARKLLR